MKLKRYNILPLIIVMAVLIINGCSEYLEENPDSRVEPQTLDDYYAIVTGAYPGAWHLFTEIMTDNYRFYDYNDFNSATLESWFTPLYLWSDNYSLNLPVGPEFAWDSYYHSIYNVNVALEGIDKISGQENFKQHIKGEALLIRAYAHFMLVNLFAKHYDPATANNDPGVPYALETEKEGIVHYERDNVGYVYQQIEKDALAGIELIDDNYLSVPQFHFNKTAAYAFMSRFYLYRGDWQKCIEYSEKALKRNRTVRDLIKDYDTYFSENDFEGFSKDYISTDKKNLLLMNKVLEWHSYPATGFYANETRTTFPDGDLRGNLFVFNDNSNLNWHTLKFIGQFKDGQQYSNAAHFTVEEVLLNHAEALILKSNPDVDRALENINVILSKRYNNHIPLSANSFFRSPLPLELSVLERIIEERRLEFCYEGHRWFDLKRYQIPVTHQTTFGEVLLEGDDPRYVLQIPEKELSANELMEPNPRP